MSLPWIFPAAYLFPSNSRLRYLRMFFTDLLIDFFTASSLWAGTLCCSLLRLQQLEQYSINICGRYYLWCWENPITSWFNAISNYGLQLQQGHQFCAQPFYVVLLSLPFHSIHWPFPAFNTLTSSYTEKTEVTGWATWLPILLSL